MTRTVAHVSISLDGFVAGPDQSLENPLGKGGLLLHQWHFETGAPRHEADLESERDLMTTCGAVVMGRNMFGPVRGDWSTWDDEWRGWWGEDPPYHAPVFVLTHYEREPVEMEGGTTFHFVTEGFEAAHARAVE